MRTVAKKLSHYVVSTELAKMSTHTQIVDFLSQGLTLTGRNHEVSGKNDIKQFY